MALEKLRTKVAVLLMDCAYHVSRDGWFNYISDNMDSYCADCDCRMPDEPSWCR